MNLKCNKEKDGQNGTHKHGRSQKIVYTWLLLLLLKSYLYYTAAAEKLPVLHKFRNYSSCNFLQHPAACPLPPPPTHIFSSSSQFSSLRAKDKVQHQNFENNTLQFLASLS
jgi:hypothetical protein